MRPYKNLWTGYFSSGSDVNRLLCVGPWPFPTHITGEKNAYWIRPLAFVPPQPHQAFQNLYEFNNFSSIPYMYLSTFILEYAKVKDSLTIQMQITHTRGYSCHLGKEAVFTKLEPALNLEH